MASYFCAPCKLCGFCSDGLAKWFFPEDRPSPIFSTFSTIYHVVTAAVAIAGATSDKCIYLVIDPENPLAVTEDKKSQLWLWIAAGTSVLHIVFAIYIYFRYWGKIKNQQPGASSSARELLCHDVGVFLYILHCIWTFVWGIIAPGCRDAKFVTAVAVLFYLFLFLTPIVMCCSLASQCGKAPAWQAHRLANPQAQPLGQPLQAQPQQQPYQQHVPPPPPPQQPNNYPQAQYSAPPPQQQYQQQPPPPPPPGQQYQQQQQQPQYAAPQQQGQPTGQPQWNDGQQQQQQPGGLRGKIGGLLGKK